MNSPELPPILVFGAHPDDIEYGCGAIVAMETQAGRRAHFVVCSKGEAASNGTAESRAAESEAAATALSASIEFIELDGDSHLQITAAHTIKLAQIIRREKPAAVLAPTWVENQHPDHARLGQLVRDAARLARYGGLKELADWNTHSIEQLFFYAVTPDGEPANIIPILFDISAASVIEAWTRAMEAHESQLATRHYVELQLTRAKLLGARAGIEYAMALYANEAMVIKSLAQAGKGARHF